MINGLKSSVDDKSHLEISRDTYSKNLITLLCSDLKLFWAAKILRTQLK